MQRLEADSQQSGSAGFVVPGFLQSAHNHLPLDFFYRRAHGEGNCVFTAKLLALLDWVRRKMVPLDLLSGTDNHGTLEDIS